MRIDNRKVEYVNCNICDSNSSDTIWVKDGFSYQVCKKCELIYISPRLTKEEIGNIYDIGFQSKNEGKPIPIDFSSYKIFFKTAKVYRKNNLLLDVGCFRGDFLYGAKKQGWDVRGVEISSDAADYGKKHYGLDIFKGRLMDSKFPDNFFDVVTLFDVIEHLTNPDECLKEVNRILRPGGLLYLDTPNFNSINRIIFKKKWSVFFPWHLYYFSPKTLEKIVQNNNFYVQKLYNIDWGPISTNNVYHSLKSKNKISKKSGFVNLLGDSRLILKPIYNILKLILNFPLIFFSYFKIYFGSKLILVAVKN